MLLSLLPDSTIYKARLTIVTQIKRTRCWRMAKSGRLTKWGIPRGYYTQWLGACNLFSLSLREVDSGHRDS